MTDRDATCEERVESRLENRVAILRDLWALYCEDPEAYHPDWETKLDEFGLWFDYVAPETFNDQPEGYFRYGLSTGGPGDEFRIYAQMLGEWSASVYRIEYWFLDWWDGAHRVLEGEDLELLKEIFASYFVESGAAHHRLTEALEDV